LRIKQRRYKVFSDNGKGGSNVPPKSKSQKAPNKARRESGSKLRERRVSSDTQFSCKNF